MNLKDKRALWERGCKICTTIKGDSSILVVTEDSLIYNRYQCIRYFQIGDNWEVSCDGDSVELSWVWKWLEMQSEDRSET